MSDDAPTPPRTRPEREAEGTAPRPARPGAEREEVPYVDDPWTKVFVAVVIVVFLAIFANAFLLGRGGLLTTRPSPSPSPTETATVAPSATPTPAVSPSPAATAPPTVTALPTATTSPSATP